MESASTTLLDSHQASASALRCGVAAWATLRGSSDTIAQWRRQPIDSSGQKLSIALLKHVEDQTVLALRAVLSAVEAAGWQGRAFTDWGVIAAPHQFGRVTNARTIERFATEGAWGVSPQLIPHMSLHAMSGTISQALQMHGPNFGVAGGPRFSPDVFLIAASLLADGILPGLWVVLTRYETEWIPVQSNAPECLAVALALTNDDTSRLQMTIEPRDADCPSFNLQRWPSAYRTKAAPSRLAHRIAYP